MYRNVRLVQLQTCIDMCRRAGSLDSSLDLGRQPASRVYIDTAVMPSQAMRYMDTDCPALATQVGH